MEWRTAGLGRPGGSEPRGPERTAPEREQCLKQVHHAVSNEEH